MSPRVSATALALEPVSLPASSRPTPPSAIALSSIGFDHTPGSARGRVLVVDDEPALLRAFSRTLTARGYEVETAPNGEAAIATLEGAEFDAILSDIAMPQMTGTELLQKVRMRDLDVPVVLITGEPAVDTAVQALEYGAFHYLTKPVAPKALEEIVDKAVCLSRMARMRRQAAAFLGQGTAAADRASLEATFERALDTLWAAYQPIVSATGKKLFGYEALLRSGEPSLPHPGAVIGAAEELQRLDALGRKMRERAAFHMVEAPPDVALFVNLHTEDLLDPMLLSPHAPLSQIASRVVLEITERASLSQVKDTKSIVAELRSMGYRIAIDDLGAGYAGLTSFATLEPEIVKLDMTLTRDIHASRTKQRLVRSMTSLCQDMGMLVVAEGIETVAERDCLVELGCDLHQGYFYAKPGKPFPEVSW